MIFSPLSGERAPLSSIDDVAFSQKLLGDGVGVRPAGSIITAPVDGHVVMTFPTKHAIGLKSDAGVEILIHVGLDTVGMAGDGFDLLVETGQRVSVGDPLLTFDRDKIVAAQCDLVTVMIITNTDEFSEIKQIGTSWLEAGDPVLEAVAK